MDVGKGKIIVARKPIRQRGQQGRFLALSTLPRVLQKAGALEAYQWMQVEARGPARHSKAPRIEFKIDRQHDRQCLGHDAK